MTPVRNVVVGSLRGLLGPALAALSALISLVACQDDSRAPNTLDSQDTLQESRSVPEYERSLRKAVISLGIANRGLGFQHNILSRLPDYTEIILLLPNVQVRPIENELRQRPYRDRVQLVPFEPYEVTDGRFFLVLPDKERVQQVDAADFTSAKQPGTAWAQDLFEVMKKPDGGIVLLISEVYKYYSAVGPKSDTQVVADNTYLKNISFAGVEVVRLPLVFQGGNLLYDVVHGRRVVFLGGDILNKTRMVWRGIFGKLLSDSEILDRVKDVYDADEVVVASIDAGDRSQPELLYHLDQAMIPLGNGVAGLARIVSESSVEPGADSDVGLVVRYLAELRDDLHRLGYEVMDIDMTAGNVLRYENAANAVPYVDVRTGRKTLLMPVFPELSDFERELEKRNIASFEALGYDVVAVPTRTEDIKGGIHCLINVLE